MEVPVTINRLSDFEVSLRNPTLLSQLLSVSKWGAVILAVVASLSTIACRLKILIVKYRRKSPIAKGPFFADEDEFDSEDETCSSSTSSVRDYREDDDDDESEFERDPWRCKDEDFRVAGGSRPYEEGQMQNRKNKFRRRFSWADFTGGRSVVKLWDHLTLGLDFDGEDDDDSSQSVIAVYDSNRENQIISHISDKNLFSAVSTSSSPPVIVTAARASQPGGVSLRVWDTRVRRRFPAILAEWTRLPSFGKIAGHAGCGGVKKLYLRDDATGDLTVGDVRNVRSPLASLKGSDVDTWWDADAVIVPEKFHDE